MRKSNIVTVKVFRNVRIIFVDAGVKCQERRKYAYKSGASKTFVLIAIACLTNFWPNYILLGLYVQERASSNIFVVSVFSFLFSPGLHWGGTHRGRGVKAIPTMARGEPWMRWSQRGLTGCLLYHLGVKQAVLVSFRVFNLKGSQQRVL